VLFVFLPTFFFFVIFFLSPLVFFFLPRSENSPVPKIVTDLSPVRNSLSPVTGAKLLAQQGPDSLVFSPHFPQNLQT